MLNAPPCRMLDMCAHVCDLQARHSQREIVCRSRPRTTGVGGRGRSPLYIYIYIYIYIYTQSTHTKYTHTHTREKYYAPNIQALWAASDITLTNCTLGPWAWSCGGTVLPTVSAESLVRPVRDNAAIAEIPTGHEANGQNHPRPLVPRHISVLSSRPVDPLRQWPVAEHAHLSGCVIPSELVGNSFDADLLGRLLSKGIPAHWIIGTIRYMLARPSIVQFKSVHH